MILQVLIKVNIKGCIPTIQTLIENNLYTVVGVAIGVAISQVADLDDFSISQLSILQLLVIWLSRTLEGQIESQKSLWNVHWAWREADWSLYYLYIVEIRKWMWIEEDKISRALHDMIDNIPHSNQIILPPRWGPHPPPLPIQQRATSDSMAFGEKLLLNKTSPENIQQTFDIHKSICIFSTKFLKWQTCYLYSPTAFHVPLLTVFLKIILCIIAFSQFNTQSLHSFCLSFTFVICVVLFTWIVVTFMPNRS